MFSFRLRRCGSNFFRLRARAFNRFEQSRGGAITGRERDRCFRQRARVVGDHRRAHARVVAAVVEDDLRLADLNATMITDNTSSLPEATIALASGDRTTSGLLEAIEIGRASCRERG